MMGFSRTLAVIRDKLPNISGAVGGDDKKSKSSTTIIAKKDRPRTGPRSKNLAKTQRLAIPDLKDLDDIGKRPITGVTVRLPRAKTESLTRSPLLVEFVGSGAIAVGPSPHMRTDLIGTTIAGGTGPGGATTTANVGLRSKPSGFANYGNVRKERRKSNKGKKRKDRKSGKR